MATIDRHPPGSVCWLELATTDQNAAKAFYSSLFGWAVNDSPMGPDEVYTIFQVDGKASAAAYSLRPEQRQRGVPAHWMLYIAVENADETVRRTGAAGGKVLAPAFDVMTYGRMAVLQDPTGAGFSIWQAGSNTGTTIAGVDGTLCWADLATSDPERATRFYTEVFGWKIAPGENDHSGYLHIQNGETFIGGIPPAEHRDSRVPPHWLLYFLTSDCDRVAARATDLGGQLRMGPMTIENVGRMAIVTDPQGATFAIFQSKQPN